MPLGLPDYSRFRVVLPVTFLEQGINDRFIDVIRDNILPYETVIAYINSTITNADIQGITDQGSSEQYNDKGDSRTFKGSLPLSRLTDKELTLTMTIKGSYLNWVIMYSQMVMFLNFKNNRPYHDDCFVQVLDADDNVIIELIYKGVRMASISPVSLATSDLGINSKSFDVKLAFNSLEVDTTIERRFK